MTDKEGPAETETAYVVLASSTNNDNNAHGQGGRDGTTVEKSVVTNEYKGEEPTNTTSQQQRNRSEDIAICCDARRYLIILNVLNLILVSVSVVVDLVSQDGPINLNEIHYGIYICNIIVTLCGIWGVVHFDPKRTLLASIGYFYIVFCSFFFPTERDYFMFDILLGVLHALFYGKIRDGIMTPENYPNKEYCCCPV